VPWPDNGCGLSEARDRIAGAATADDDNRNANADCVAALRGGRLIAYGRTGLKGSREQLIGQREWHELTRIDWMADRSGIVVAIS
jgi:hypothetical protein